MLLLELDGEDELLLYDEEDVVPAGAAAAGLR